MSAVPLIRQRNHFDSATGTTGGGVMACSISDSTLPDATAADAASAGPTVTSESITSAKLYSLISFRTEQTEALIVKVSFL
jgi:hypothetical protein